MGRGWRSFSTVIGFNAPTIVMKDKSAATNTTGLWFDQGQNHLNGDGRIHGGSTGFQNIVASLGGQWVCTGHSKSSGRTYFFDGVADGLAG